MIKKEANLTNSSAKINLILDKKYKEIEKIKPIFDNILREIAEKNNSEAVIVPLKSKERTLQKIIIEYEGQVNKVKDILRGSIVSKTSPRISSILKSIKEKFEVISIKDRFSNPIESTNYRDILINVKIKGIVAEIQINLEQLLKVKEYINHLFYEINRNIETASKKEGREIYSWEEYIKNKVLEVQKYSNYHAWQRQLAYEHGEDTKKMIFMVTHDREKYLNLKAFIPNLRPMIVPLSKIQSSNPHKIIKDHIHAAFSVLDAKIITENLALYCHGIDNLPGPLLKPFLKLYYKKAKKSSLIHFAKMVIASGNTKATLTSTLGFAERPSKTYFFENSIDGDIVLPRGKGHYDLAYIFQPKGMKKTLAEMTPEEKNKQGLEKAAVDKLINFLQRKYNIVI